MQTHSIVQASADVLTITTLRPGDVYKRLATGAYGTEGRELRFGVVQSVMNNGTDAAVSTLEYSSDYNGATARPFVIESGSDVAIFPALPDEVTAHVDKLLHDAMGNENRAREALDKATAATERVRQLAAQLGTLTAPETTTPVLDAAPSDV